jgi:hypothetical protein
LQYHTFLMPKDIYMEWQIRLGLQLMFVTLHMQFTISVEQRQIELVTLKTVYRVLISVSCLSMGSHRLKVLKLRKSNIFLLVSTSPWFRAFGSSRPVSNFKYVVLKFKTCQVRVSGFVICWPPILVEKLAYVRAALHLEAGPIPLEADCMKFQPSFGLEVGLNNTL